MHKFVISIFRYENCMKIVKLTFIIYSAFQVVSLNYNVETVKYNI